jgi:hypothetical protein
LARKISPSTRRPEAEGTCKPDKDGDLDCKTGEDEIFEFHIMNVKAARNSQEMATK